MFVRTLDELRKKGVEKVLCEGKARTVRFVNKRDGMGFTMADVRLAPGMNAVLWCKNHWEANYVVAGRGRLTNLTTGQAWEMEPGMLNVVGPRDRHRVETETHIHIISVFNPPLEGNEKHDADGAYEPSGPIPPGKERMFVKTVREMEAQGKRQSAAAGSATTLRMLTKDNGIGITISDVHMKAGNSNRLWYKNHWEANYILAGRGRVEDLTTGESWVMEPGMLYNVGPKDRHAMHSETDLHLISIFCPALQGDEKHDADGTLEASGPVPPGPEGY